MEILRNIQNQSPLSPAIQTFCIHFPQLQLLYLFLAKQHIPYYHDILDILNIESVFVMQVLVIGQLCARSSILTVLGSRYFGLVNQKNFIENIVLKFLKVKIKILIVCSLHWNTLAYRYCDTFIAAIALFNLLGTVGELIVTRILNSSYRFEQENLVCQKNTSLFASMLLFPIIYLMDFENLFSASCLISLRCLAQLYYNFKNVENRAIQYCDYFSPLMMLSLCLIEIISDISSVQFYDSTHPLNFLLIMVFICYSSHSLAETLIVIVPKYHLKKCPYFLKDENSQQSLESEAANLFNERDEYEFTVVLRVLAKVYVARQKAEGLFMMKQNPYHPSPENQNEFDVWWRQFHKVIINHRVYCTNIACQCNKVKRHSKQNSMVESRVFLQVLLSSLQNVMRGRHSIKLQIIQKYFFIELIQKPIKNYYHLMKLKDKVKKSDQILQVQAIMLETRQKFGHLLNSQKVQNQQLQINSLLKFQDTLREIKVQFIDLSFNYKKFYQLFSTLIVEVSLLKKLTSNLVSIKKQINYEIDQHMDRFSKNYQFLSYCLIYYKYFNEYSQNTNRIQSTVNTINQLNQNLLEGQKLIETSVKKPIDVFNTVYGAIRIDLVQKPGEIIKATKNICALLGFKRNQMQGQKVNKIMPYIFARYHDKYLKNFIEFGSIKTLKEKERIFYARNSHKFIFPITLRLKIEYLSSEGFFANSLIKKTQTKSQFVLLNNYGKIEQISQKLYKILFFNSFKEELSKAKRINIYKMLLSLNHFVKNPSQMDQQTYEGMITTVDSEQLMQSYYKILQLRQKKNKFQNSNEDQKTHSSRNRVRKQTKDYSESMSSFSQSKTKQPDFDLHKCQNDMKQTLKEFYLNLDIEQIRAYRITYKFSDLVTAEFTCKILEILSIKQEMSSNGIKMSLPQQILQIGQLYGLEQSNLSKFRNIKVNQQATAALKKSFGTLLNFKELTYKGLFSDQQTISRANQFKQNLNNQNPGSVTSLNSNNQKIQRKAGITTSFNLKVSVNQRLESILRMIIFSVVFALILICVVSISIEPDYNRLQKDNLIISNFKISFEFRLAFQELEHFYHFFHLPIPSFFNQKKHVLTEKMKEQLVNSIKWIDGEISDDSYFDPIVLTHVDSRFKESRSLISTLNQIYSMFLMNEEQGQHLSDNYVTIRRHLDNLFAKEKQSIIQTSSTYIYKIHAILGTYSLIVLVLTVIFVMINQESKKKEKHIVDFLPFMNVKQVKEKMYFYDQLMENLKENQQVSINGIQKILIQCKDKILLQKTQKSLKKSKKVSIQQTRAQSRLKQKDNTPIKDELNSRFIRVNLNQKKTLGCLGCLIWIIIPVIFIGIVFPTQSFFTEAHDKFVTYIELKESTMMIKNMVPRALLIDLINMGKILNLEPIVEYPSEFYLPPSDQLFDLRHKLASYQYFDTELAKSLNDHFNKNICKFMKCDSDQINGNQLDVYYLTYRFINAIQYIGKSVRFVLPHSTNPRQEVLKWMTENNIKQLFNYIEHISELMNQNQQQMTRIFIDQINFLGYSLLQFTLILIPLLVICLYFVRKRFIVYVHERLSSIETVYKQFGWDLLAENTYVLNYFENKLKNSKNY